MPPKKVAHCPLGAPALACDVGASPALARSSRLRPGPDRQPPRSLCHLHSRHRARSLPHRGPVALARGLENELVPVRGTARRRGHSGPREELN